MTIDACASRARAALMRFAAVALACGAIAAAHAQPPAEPAAMTAVKLAPGETIRMDGSLSDPVWQRAPIHKDFVQREPNYGQPTPYETHMQVVMPGTSASRHLASTFSSR